MIVAFVLVFAAGMVWIIIRYRSKKHRAIRKRNKGRKRRMYSNDPG